MNEIIKSAINRVKLKGENIWTRYSYWTKAKDVELENGETVEDKILDINTNLLNHVANKSNPHNVTKAQLELENVDNTKDEDKIVSTLQREAIDMSYQQSTGYTDKKIADLIGSAPTTLDTLEEIAKAMQKNDDVVTALHESIGSKATQAELDGHINNSTIHITATEREKWNAQSDRGNYTELGRYYSDVGYETGIISANLSEYIYLILNFIYEDEILDSKILPRKLFTDYCDTYPIKLTFGSYQAQVRHVSGSIHAFVNTAYYVVVAYGIK